MSLWLLATFGSSFTWSIADVACDICIEEHSDDESDDEDDEDTPEIEMVSLLPADSKQEESALKNTHETELQNEQKSLKRNSSVSSTTANGTHNMNRNQPHSAEPVEMNGEQDCAVSGMVTMIVVYVLCLNRWSKYIQGTTNQLLFDIVEPVNLWSPLEDPEWWLAAVGGVFMFWHYIFLLWAYDSAPSTVINPLLQVCSTWVLLGSAVPAALTGKIFITPFDFMCYLIIIFGGIIPSLDGNFKKMFTIKFWRKPFVRYAVLCEVTVGVYDLMLSYVLQNTHLQVSQGASIDPNRLENEYFFISWSWFTIAFAVSYSIHPRLREEFSNLAKLPRKTLSVSAIGNGLALLGYYSSYFAYAWYYQASVVHAAESSMNQAFNLLIAYVMRRCFLLGRESAVRNMRMKMVSCVVVSAGLFLLAIYGENQPERRRLFSKWPA